MSPARSWELAGASGGWLSRRLEGQRRRLNRWIVEYLSAVSGRPARGRVLEGGSGSGYASSLFAAEPWVRLSVAADADIDALREARRRDPRLPVVVADLRRLPFREGSFDLVWNSSTLEHIDAPGAAMAEMHRVTGAGGHVFVGVPNRFGALGFQPLVAHTRWGIWIGPVFDRRRLAALMGDTGLRPIASRTYFYGVFLGIVARKPMAPASDGGVL